MLMEEKQLNHILLNLAAIILVKNDAEGGKICLFDPKLLI